MGGRGFESRQKRPKLKDGNFPFSETPLFLIKCLSQIKKARVHRPRSRGFVPGVWGLTREQTAALRVLVMLIILLF